MKMQYGIRAAKIQQYTHIFAQMSLNGPIIHPQGKNRLEPGQVSYFQGINPLNCFYILYHFQSDIIWQMNRREKARKPDQILDQLLHLIFSKQEFNPRAFLPVAASISKDQTMLQPSCILFALYNLFVRDESGQIPENCVRKILTSNPNSAAAVAALVIKSAFEAYNKKYKQSLESLNNALQIGTNPDADRQYSEFYHKVVAKMIEIHDLTTFRRQYMQFIEKVLNQFQDVYPHSEFIKSLQMRNNQLKEKVCLSNHRPKLQTVNSASRLTRTKYSNMNPYDDGFKEREKSVHSRSNSQQSLMSREKGTTISKRQFKKYQYVNPYELTEAKSDHCAFM